MVVCKILTDRGTHFTGSMMQHILKLLNIKHLLTTAYHAQCDGQAGRALKTFVGTISHFVSDGQRNWCQLYPLAEWCMNTMKLETTGYSPFEMVFGR
jgi:transposase InsO family protein